VSSPRILLIRTSALGDVVQALPVLSALRRHYPKATIGWVIEKTFSPLLEGHPDLDELMPVGLRSWRRTPLSPDTWRETAVFLRRLQGFSAEIVLDLMGNHKAGILAALSLSDRRLGSARASRREPSSSIWMSETVKARGEHAVDRMLSILDGLGLPAEPADFAGQLLPENGSGAPGTENPYVLLHPATGWHNKDYPAARWAKVVRRLAAAGVTVLVAPGPGEEELAERIRTMSTGGAQVLDPATIPTLVFLQRRASLVLGGDTGPVHLAHALGTPVLCVMGPTDPTRHGPYDALDHAIWVRLACSFCHKRLDSAKACLLSIEPDAVADRALEILDFRLH
jgi:lipopolysaccharide heptosyltransferase I